MEIDESLFQPGIVDIPMDKITLGGNQARQRDTKVSKDDDLVISIKKHGLLYPILVRSAEDGKYELVAGQRRYHAHEELAKLTIKARILALNTSEADAKKISLIENLARKDMKHADYVDTVQWFVDRYGKISTVAEELGVSPNTVRRYLSISRLPEEIRSDIHNKEYGQDHALKAFDALGGDDSTVNVPLLRETAKALSTISPQARKKFVKIKKSQPGASVSDVVKKAKERTKLNKFTIEFEFGDDQIDRIDHFMHNRGISKRSDAVSELIDMGLKVVEE